MLRTAMHQQRRSFKETLNSALRTGLSGKREQTQTIAFKVHAKPMGLKAGIDPTGLNKAADDLEIEGGGKTACREQIWSACRMSSSLASFV